MDQCAEMRVVESAVELADDGFWVSLWALGHSVSCGWTAAQPIVLKL